jgi:hypothetical protein
MYVCMYVCVCREEGAARAAVMGTHELIRRAAAQTIEGGGWDKMR